MIASTSFISDTLGARYIEPIPLNLDSIATESTCRTPVIFLLSAGSDPSSLIEGLSRKHKKELRYISMGQGQEIQARRLLQEGIKSGGWVLLQNCHLGLKFLPEVEDTLTKTEVIFLHFSFPFVYVYFVGNQSWLPIVDYHGTTSPFSSFSTTMFYQTY